MRIVVTGARGQLGACLRRALSGRDVTFLDRAALDVTDRESVGACFAALNPDAVIHAAAMTDVDECERDPSAAQRVNARACGIVAAAAGDALVVVVSTDYVFDGTLGRAYAETDEPRPLQVYGRTKLLGEREALAAGARVAILRTAWLYGAHTSAGARNADAADVGAAPARTSAGAPTRNFVAAIVRAARSGPINVVDDQVGSPTSAHDFATALATFVERPAPGVFHAVNSGVASRYEFARAIVAGAGLSPDLVRPIATGDAPLRPAARPAYAPLDGAAWRAQGFDPLPPWEDALARALPDMLAAL